MFLIEQCVISSSYLGPPLRARASPGANRHVSALLRCRRNCWWPPRTVSVRVAEGLSGVWGLDLQCLGHFHNSHASLVASLAVSASSPMGPCRFLWVSWVVPVYTTCVLGVLRFFNKIFYLPKKKK
jgi:hypothetical protein